MKKRVLLHPALLILVCLFSPISSYSSQLEPHTDQTVKDFTLKGFDDQARSLSDYKGKVVLVNFWASWCPPCIYEMPELTKLKKRFSDRPFEIIAINVGEKKYKVRKFAKLINLELPILLDTSSETFNDWDVKTLPSSFLIDSNGTIHYQVRGNPGWELEETINIIESIMPESSPSKPTSITSEK